MGRGDLAEHIRVVDEGAEEIDGVHQHVAAGDIDDRRVIGRVETDEHVRAAAFRHALQGALQHGGADLGSAATATLREVGDRGDRPGIGEPVRQGRRRR